MTNPLSHRLRAYVAEIVKKPMLPHVVTIPFQPGECREQRADDLRQWCAANCVGEWRPRERWTAEGASIAFACASDAVTFRLTV